MNACLAFSQCICIKNNEEGEYEEEEEEEAVVLER
jgi:hypothetical protein